MSTTTRNEKQKTCSSWCTQTYYDHHAIYLNHNVKEVKPIIDSMQEKRNITKINIRYSDEHALSERDVNCLYHAIGSLPNLRKFQVRFPEGVPVQYEALSTILRTARNLDEFDLNCIDFGADSLETVDEQKEFHDFVESIRNHQSLQTFQLAASRPNSLDCTIQSLATVPNLTVLKIFSKMHPRYACYSRLSTSSAKILCSMQNLQTLKLAGIELQNEGQLFWIAQSLRTNTNLNELVLTKCQLDNQCAIEIAQSLQLNITLEKLDLSWNQITDSGCIAIAQAVESNQSLLSLLLHPDNSITERSYPALLRMLERNYTLRTLSVVFKGSAFNEKVKFYTELNKVGKRHIVRNTKTTANDFVNALFSHHKSVPALFYYVSMIPHLVDPQHKYTAEVELEF